MDRWLSIAKWKLEEEEEEAEEATASELGVSRTHTHNSVRSVSLLVQAACFTDAPKKRNRTRISLSLFISVLRLSGLGRCLE